MQLNEYRIIFRERMLDLAWRQWVALGLKGYGSTWKGPPVDPEALIAFTCQVGRGDPRLFDGMLEWVGHNVRWINVTRMKRMLTLSGVVPIELFLAMVERSDSSLLPKFTATRRAVALPDQSTPLFFGKDDQPLPMGRTLDTVFGKWGLDRGEYQKRGVCGPFHCQGAETLLLQLRAFLGLNARAELLMHLLLNGENSSRAMARICGYAAPSVSKALSEMSESGWVGSYSEGRRVLYSLKDREAWWSLLVGGAVIPKAVDWFAVLSALVCLHHHLGVMTRDDTTPRQQASRIRRLVEQETFEGLNHVAPELRIGGLRLPPGEELIPVFQKQVDQILDRLMMGQK